MTMQEIKKGFISRRNFMKKVGLTDLIGYMKQMEEEAELLYKEGYIKSCSDEFMAYANGYQINSGDYETIQILQTYGLNSIKATKKTARELAEYILNH